MIRVLLVDDQHLVREGFARLLRDVDDIEVVGEAADGGTAVLTAAETSPDVVLMDVRMPGMDGSRPRSASFANIRTFGS